MKPIIWFICQTLPTDKKNEKKEKYSNCKS